jgi:translation initiation factor 1
MKKPKAKNSTAISQTVYSTDEGDLRRRGLGSSHVFEGLLPDLKPSRDTTTGRSNCSQKRNPSEDSSKPAVVRLERKGRGGKTVTIIENLRPKGCSVEDILRRLKARLGCGGTMEGSQIIIQGDHRKAIAEWLQSEGYPAKVSGPQ